MGYSSSFKASWASHFGSEFDTPAVSRQRTSTPASFNWINDDRRTEFRVLIVTRVCLILPLLLSLPAMASTYTVTAAHLTMHVGDPVPPLIFSISDYPGSYASNFIGEPARSTLATSKSPPGNYPIFVSQGSLKSVDPRNHLRFVNGTLKIVPADSIGAQLNYEIAYPLGLFDGPTGHAAILSRRT